MAFGSTPAPGSATLDFEEVDILIVGAGPAGLATALSIIHHSKRLVSQGIKKPKLLICEACLQGKDESRAYVMHARTLEVSLPYIHTI